MPGPEIDVAINPPVRPLLRKVAGLGGNQRQRPFFELVIFAPRRQIARTLQVLRHAVGGELHARKGIAQPLFNQPDRQMRHVDAHPLPPQLLRRMNGGAAAAERIEHGIAEVRLKNSNSSEKIRLNSNLLYQLGFYAHFQILEKKRK